MANEESNSATQTEAEVNAAAAKEVEQSSDASAKAGDSGKGTQDVSGKTTDKPGTTEQSFDAQKRYEDLDKRYKDLQREFTPLSQERSRTKTEMDDLRKQVKTFQEALAVATKKPIDIEQFKRDFDAHGPKALESYFKEMLEAQLKAQQEQFDGRYKELSEKHTKLEGDHTGLSSQYAVLVRANDDQNYPNFRELYPKMCDLAKDPNCKIDLSQPIDKVIDDLYKQAREQSSGEAVRIAADERARKAEERIAAESRTTVATGGKTASTSTPDAEKMPLGDLEKILVAQYGIADRE